MAQIDDGSEIEEVKKTLERLTAEGLVTRWEIPYEYLFTRLYSALFYLEPTSPESETRIWQALSAHGEVLHRANTWQGPTRLPIGFRFNGQPEPVPAASTRTAETIKRFVHSHERLERFVHSHERIKRYVQSHR